MANRNKKMAVFAGCTYPGTEASLQGPINDVSRMRGVLIQRFGFKPSNIVFMTDAPDSTVMPTGANIRSALKLMFRSAQTGDHLFFHFSGHGTRIPRLDGDGEDEAIVPCDFNLLILDEEMKKLMKWLPKGVCFTFLSDACISGGFIDKEDDHSRLARCHRCINKTEQKKSTPVYSASSPASPRPPRPRCIFDVPFRLRINSRSQYPRINSPSQYPRNIFDTPPRPNIGHIAPPPAPPPPPPPRTRTSNYLTHYFMPLMRSVTTEDASHPETHFGKCANIGHVVPAPPPPPLQTGTANYLTRNFILEHKRSVTTEDASHPETHFGNCANVGHVVPAPPPPPPLQTGTRNYLTRNFILEHKRSVTKQDASHLGVHFGNRANIGHVVPVPPPPPPLAPPPSPPRTGKSKYLTHDFILNHLRSVTKGEASHVRCLLRKQFGKDASRRLFTPQEEQDVQQRMLDPYIVVFFSGAKIGEISVDVVEESNAFGALSNAVQLVLNSYDSPTIITNEILATRVRNRLDDQGFTKNHSCLYCCSTYYDTPFLSLHFS
ncbi:hypothetical protein RND81_12G020300 [Saponaria officinalis]|uniref:Peptidase C14 caspase domain-containing protein n=1 Tax=Saponaria officinalis TaxID=3572 RepID=A0AAW1H277_SAPOF